MKDLRALCDELELVISENSLKAMLKHFRMEHGEEAKAMLMAHLRRIKTELGDQVRIPGKTTGYVEVPFGQAPYRRRILAEDPTEPEIMPLAEDDVRARHDAFDVLKGEEKARREARSRYERARQAELELRRRGKPHEHHVQAIEAHIEAMRRDAA